MARYGADEPKSSIHLNLAARKDSITRSTDPVKSKISSRLNSLYDKPDLVHMRAEHENRILALAALDASDIAVSVDLDLIYDRLDAIPRITDDRLFEPGDAVKGR
jgi:hypothetical protein